MAVPDRRSQDYREVREGRGLALTADFEAGRIGEETYRASLLIAGFSRAEASELVMLHRPFKTLGQAATDFVSGLPDRWRNG